MPSRPPAQKTAEKTYREKFVSVLVRLTPQEAKKIDAARAEISRAEYLKRKGLER